MQLFDGSVVINLDKRTDRWQNFQQRARKIPFFVERVPGIQANSGLDINGMSQQCSACIMSHVSVIRMAHTRGWRGVLILEDDVVPCDDLADRMRYIEERIPNDWEHIYLGGQVVDTERMVRIDGDSHLFHSVRTNGTYAYILRNTAYRKVLYEFVRGYSTLDGMYAEMVEAVPPRRKVRRTLPFLQTLIDVVRPVPLLRSYTFIPTCFDHDNDSPSSVQIGVPHLSSCSNFSASVNTK